MKKSNLLFLLLFLGVFQISYAQKFGVKGGILINDVQAKVNSTDPDVMAANFKPALGFVLGTMYQQPVGEKFSIKGELSYLLKKNNSLSGANGENRLHYIDLTLLGMIPIFENATFDIGLDAAYLAKLKFEGVKHEKFDLGLTAGFSYLINESIEISARYNYSLTPSNEIDLPNIGNEEFNVKYYNRNFQVALGYYF